jgi:hypothetical protein
VYSIPEYRNIINPSKLSRGMVDGYHVDHIFPKKAGFLLQINPLYMSHPLNLRMLFCLENMRKCAEIIISKEEYIANLMEIIKDEEYFNRMKAFDNGIFCDWNYSLEMIDELFKLIK